MNSTSNTNSNTNSTEAALQEHIRGQREEIFAQLSEIIAFNSVYLPDNPELKEEHTNAGNWVDAALADAGLEVSAIPTADGSTTYLASTPKIEGAPTVLLYSHYDVVLAGDPAEWTADPFTLTERNGRWYARGAADCKGSLAMHLAGLRAVDDTVGLQNLGINLRVLVEGSEEQGGDGLDKLIKERPELFQADVMLIADGGNVAAGTPTITTALRGGAQLKVSVDTLRAPVHSGLFGGVAPDATLALLRALDSLFDDNGHTVIRGFEPTDDAKWHWDGASYDAATFRSDAGVLDGVGLHGKGTDEEIAAQLWSRPAATVTALSSRPTSDVVNAVTHHAEAVVNLRVPFHLDTQDVVEAAAQQIRDAVPFDARIKVTAEDVFSPFSTSTDSAAFETFESAMATAFGKDVRNTGNGASIPLTTALAEANPDADIAVYGLCEPQTTIHSPDESVDPEEIIRLATTEALFITRLSEQARNS
ncbi:M20/M25/M40 family metallo-hydrolase [Corynebacterium propinquum]|uniref:M20/M25/M40 family metallo-hydrolase n=1 Tax=Corynebacterium propinquum TaxID=43769 RepID=A0ABT7G206_9CORY|nr:M20/M25/M40 family metallo-hydrolase [Corynebacterium propinquum]MDK4234906.1 M20/M25/M40 family metallo-hydrolase [Corynebacterium propinquum]MDK4238419.1 M20/M25/M40 family metallo-hydrolase [Corynebacterium propinquum]MDK4300750.1 M20/M25/M40 family metallo-hydrolase [Corynebacterium propinquum]MDK4314023.1 M20/M25/M40 family metallo-hydrolase [Corynebacterium propinquum]WKS31334.1 M20/M25/M40 family metallo-hydrolase [Corynebacterium propinquum]